MALEWTNINGHQIPIYDQNAFGTFSQVANRGDAGAYWKDEGGDWGGNWYKDAWGLNPDDGYALGQLYGADHPYANWSNWSLTKQGTEVGDFMGNPNLDQSGFDGLLKVGDKEGMRVRYTLQDGKYVPTLVGNQDWNSNMDNTGMGIALSMVAGGALAGMAGAGAGAAGAGQTATGAGGGFINGFPVGSAEMIGGTGAAAGWGGGAGAGALGGVGGAAGATTPSSTVPGATVEGLWPGATQASGTAVPGGYMGSHSMGLEGILSSVGGAGGAGGIVDMMLKAGKSITEVEKLLGLAQGALGGGGQGGQGGGGVGGLIGAGYSADRNRDYAAKLMEMFQHQRNMQQPFYDRLVQTYTDPSVAMNSAEYKQGRDVYQNSIDRQAAKSGTLGNPTDRERLLDAHGAKWMSQHRQDLLGNLKGTDPAAYAGHYALGAHYDSNSNAPWFAQLQNGGGIGGAITDIGNVIRAGGDIWKYVSDWFNS